MTNRFFISELYKPWGGNVRASARAREGFCASNFRLSAIAPCVFGFRLVRYDSVRSRCNVRVFRLCGYLGSGETSPPLVLAICLPYRISVPPFRCAVIWVWVRRHRHLSGDPFYCRVEPVVVARAPSSPVG